MKNRKRIMITALVAIVGSVALFASPATSGITADVSMAAGTNGILLTNDHFEISLEPEASIYFDGNNGINTRLSWSYDGDSNMGLGIGYTYKDKLTDTLDMALKAGFDYSWAPRENMSRHGYGMYLGVDFSMDLVDDWFFSFGVRDTMEFAHTVTADGMDSKTDSEFNNNLVLPRVSVGYSF